jgi:hypothetical protein
MHIPPPELSGAAEVSRRVFLTCCSALALASSGCARLAPQTRVGYTLIADPPLEQYRPILDGLIHSILPSERADFPVSMEHVRARLLTLFRLDDDPRFLTLQKALVLFDQTDLFARRLVPVQEEATALDADARGLDVQSVITRSHALDIDLYKRFVRGQTGAPRFALLPLDRQREYLELWRDSGYLIKRQFYASARSLVMISAYSMDVLWPAIRYGGPLLPPDRT